MNIKPSLDSEDEVLALITELYPICRSITGNGVRETLRIIRKLIPLAVHEIPSGTQVFDWTIPKEWNINDAYVIDPRGEKIIDFQAHNLHILNYSIPIHKKVNLDELKQHLFSIPEQPELIPYRTSYYRENWGFCVTHNLLETLIEGEYEVCIDSTLVNGSLTYGEYFIQGDSEDEFLISTHCCHPSLCNDNLSGIALTTFLAKELTQRKLRYSYRFLFIPGTIGSITWLSINKENAHKIKHGLVVACVGDSGGIHYKKSRRGSADIDRAVFHVLKHEEIDFEIEDFSPYGYDERQYCSPGFNLPVGSLTRTPHGRFPEYHSSADGISFISSKEIEKTLSCYLQVIELVENNQKYVNTNPYCEPQLGKRGLYGAFGGKKDANLYEMALLWVLNLSDGDHSLLDIAEISGYSFSIIYEAAIQLEKSGLLTLF